MKKMILFLTIVCLGVMGLISCSKANLSLVKDTWSGYYVVDTVKASSKDSAKILLFDCPGDRKWNADTVLPYNHGEPQAVATTWQEITPGKMQFIDKYLVEIAPGRWQRVYFIYKAKKAK